MFHMYNEGLLHHPQQTHNPCYRKVISYSYFRIIKNNTLEEGEAVFTRMLAAIESNQFFTHQGYIEIYPTVMDNKGEYGYVIVEPARGCFPLVTYPCSHTQYDNKANKTRVSGFKTAIEKLKKNRQKIFAVLNEHNEWTHELEAKLELLFEYPKKRAAVNSAAFNSGDIKKSG